ncbi:hypothetical protein DV736_g1601, partial [Chaetothyriales sp. CBS 134916]
MAHFYQRARRVAYGTPSEQAGNALGKGDGDGNEDKTTSRQTKGPLDTTSQSPPKTAVSKSPAPFPRIGTKVLTYYCRRNRSSRLPNSPSPTPPAAHDAGKPGSDDKKSKTWPEMIQVDSPHPSHTGSKLYQKTSPPPALPPSKTTSQPTEIPE